MIPNKSLSLSLSFSQYTGLLSRRILKDAHGVFGDESEDSQGDEDKKGILQSFYTAFADIRRLGQCVKMIAFRDAMQKAEEKRKKQEQARKTLALVSS